MYKVLADIVEGLHILLMVFLGAGLIMAVAGKLKDHPWWSRLYWPIFLVTALAQLLPTCPLTSIEAWLRHHYDPSWDQTHSLENFLQHSVSGVWVPEWVFTLGLLVLVGGSLYAWFRYHSGRHWLRFLQMAVAHSHST